jgi:hypothetical protein
MPLGIRAWICAAALTKRRILIVGARPKERRAKVPTKLYGGAN